MSINGFGVGFRRIAFGGAVLAAVAAGIGVPGVAAARPGDVTTTVSVSGQPATGCGAQVTATVAGSSALGLGRYVPPVEFWDDSTFLGSVTPTVVGATPGTGPALTAVVQWKPATTGTHVLRAKYAGGNYTPASEGSLRVQVGTGLDLGSACLPLG